MYAWQKEKQQDADQKKISELEQQIERLKTENESLKKTVNHTQKEKMLLGITFKSAEILGEKLVSVKKQRDEQAKKITDQEMLIQQQDTYIKKLVVDRDEFQTQLQDKHNIIAEYSEYVLKTGVEIEQLKADKQELLDYHEE